VATFHSASVDAALAICVNQVCAYTGWPIGHAYLPTSDGDLAPTCIWCLGDKNRFAEFVKATEATRLARGVGLPGRVLEDKAAAWITDLCQDRNFPRAAAARDLGLCSAFAFPVVSCGEVVAVLEFFADDPREPDELLLEAMGHIGLQLGQVFERRAKT
jgi:hypothetical protein